MQCSAYYQRSGRESTLGGWGGRSCTWTWTADLMCYGWLKFWGIVLQRAAVSSTHILNFVFLTCSVVYWRAWVQPKPFLYVLEFYQSALHIFIEPLSHLTGLAHLGNGDPENDVTKDEFQCSLQNTLFSDCMQRFLYARCCKSPEFIDALKVSSLCLRPYLRKSLPGWHAHIFLTCLRWCINKQKFIATGLP